MRVLMIGAGGVGDAAARIAAERSFFDAWVVADHDVSHEPVYAGRRIPGAGGVGLHMARQLSLDVGWYRTETVKTVWATFAA